MTSTPSAATSYSPQEQLNGHSDIPIALLPQRNPGASGISDVPTSMATAEPNQTAEAHDEWPVDSMPAQTSQPDPSGSIFAAAVSQRPSHGADRHVGLLCVPHAGGQSRRRPSSRLRGTATTEIARHAAHVADEASPTAGADDPIYQKMLSEWLIDPTELGEQHLTSIGTRCGITAGQRPLRPRTHPFCSTPSTACRCASPARGWCPGRRIPPCLTTHRNGGHRTGGAHRSDDRDDEVASAAEFDTGPLSIPRRDPDAVRASISNHFGGVHAGRSHARGDQRNR